VTVGAADGATATAASAAGDGMDVGTYATPSAVANDAHASGASVAGTDMVVEAVPTRKRQHMTAAQANEADTADGATATVASTVGASPRPTKGRKRTSSRGQAHAARRAAFLPAQ